MTSNARVVAGTKSNLFVEMGLVYRIFSPNVHECPFLFHFHSEVNLVFQLSFFLMTERILLVALSTSFMAYLLLN